jgi:hypothetical protein
VSYHYAPEQGGVRTDLSFIVMCPSVAKVAGETPATDMAAIYQLIFQLVTVFPQFIPFTFLALYWAFNFVSS